jgi:HAD superfamily hydrolase (TIGR01549 family)
VKALIFDLDGTLVDSVYPHTLAWQQSLSQAGIDCPAWAIHRRIGMSGELLVKAVAREQHRRLNQHQIRALSERHARLFHKHAADCRALPGALELLRYLRTANIAHGIATSGRRAEIKRSLKTLSLHRDAIVIDGDMVAEVKPEPDLFLACQQALQVKRDQCVVVGDAVWDIHAARRSGILSVALLTGGFGEQELYNAGAMRVYRDPDDLLAGLNELGFS